MFTIIYLKLVNKELVKMFYGADGIWRTYANDCMTFKTAVEAKQFYNQNKWYMKPTDKTVLYVHGSRGGHTRMGDISNK